VTRSWPVCTDRRFIYHPTAHPRILKIDVGYYPIEDTIALIHQLIRHSAHPVLVRSALEFNTDRKACNGLALDLLAILVLPALAVLVDAIAAVRNRRLVEPGIRSCIH
jgi:hypothetical protein